MTDGNQPPQSPLELFNCTNPECKKRKFFLYRARGEVGKTILTAICSECGLIHQKIAEFQSFGS